MLAVDCAGFGLLEAWPSAEKCRKSSITPVELLVLLRQLGYHGALQDISPLVSGHLVDREHHSEVRGGAAWRGRGEGTPQRVEEGGSPSGRALLHPSLSPPYQDPATMGLPRVNLEAVTELLFGPAFFTSRGALETNRAGTVVGVTEDEGASGASGWGEGCDRRAARGRGVDRDGAKKEGYRDVKLSGAKTTTLYKGVETKSAAIVAMVKGTVRVTSPTANRWLGGSRADSKQPGMHGAYGMSAQEPVQKARTWPQEAQELPQFERGDYTNSKVPTGVTCCCMLRLAELLPFLLPPSSSHQPLCFPASPARPPTDRKRLSGRMPRVSQSRPAEHRHTHLRMHSPRCASPRSACLGSSWAHQCGCSFARPPSR